MISIFNRIARQLENLFSPVVVEPQNAGFEMTRFTDVQRTLRIYLRALWDCDFILKQATVDSLGEEIDRAFIEYFVINLPIVFHDNVLPDGRYVKGIELYRAAATHAAAHLRYRNKHFSARSLDKWQIAVISLIEDARVETLAIREFPGLKPFWALFHTVTPQENRTAGNYLDRLARALLDETYQDDDSWVTQGRTLFNFSADLEDDQIPLLIGVKLADSFRKKNIRFNIHTDMPTVSYRDDNRYLWRRQSEPLEIFSPFFRAKSSAGNEDDDRDLIKRPAPESVVLANAKPLSATFIYPEWNYRSQSEDQAWVTLRESSPASGDLTIIDKIVAENQHLIARMKSLLRAIREGAAHRIRKLEEGDEIDINAAIRAQIDINHGIPPDTRVMIRSARKTRDISVLMLLDLSRSMNDKMQMSNHTALQLTQQVSVLFAEAIKTVGDPFAIHGFNSDTRHFVEYVLLKGFHQPYDEGSKARIAGMKGQRGTRMGAAIRHATYHLNKQKSGKKLLLIMTDGEPSDIDMPNHEYLHIDAKKSVNDARRSGIHTYCISLDPGADRYVTRIFGATNYMVVDHIKSLPEKVLLIYAGLTR